MGFSIKSLAIPYFRMANCHTIIGAKRFHFRVRDGVGWFTLAMVTKQTGVADSFITINCQSGNYSNTFSFSLLFTASAAPTVSLSIIALLEICNISGAFSCFKAFQKSFANSGLSTPGNYFLSSSSAALVHQTDWVLYGQASRAISTR